MHRFFDELFLRSGYTEKPRFIQVLGGPQTGKTSALCQLVAEDFEQRLAGEGFDTHPVLYISCCMDLSGVLEWFDDQYFKPLGKDLFFHNFIPTPSSINPERTLLTDLPRHPAFVDPELLPRMVVLDNVVFDSVNEETALINFLRGKGVGRVLIAPREPLLGEHTTIEAMGNGYYQVGQFTNLYPRRTHNALLSAFAYGPIDGDHHKAWVIDNMVRNLTEQGYRDWVKMVESDEDGMEADYEWDTGIAP